MSTVGCTDNGHVSFSRRRVVFNPRMDDCLYATVMISLGRLDSSGAAGGVLRWRLFVTDYDQRTSVWRPSGDQLEPPEWLPPTFALINRGHTDVLFDPKPQVDLERVDATKDPFFKRPINLRPEGLRSSCLRQGPPRVAGVAVFQGEQMAVLRCHEDHEHIGFGAASKLRAAWVDKVVRALMQASRAF